MAGNTASPAFIYSNGTMAELGTLGGSSSIGSGINTSGQVVGYSFILGDSAFYSFLYTPGQGMVDLTTLIPSGSGWTLDALNSWIAINDNGQITGTGMINGHVHAFLLTPNNPYKAFIQQPTNADGKSIFKATRGVIPIKFSLPENDNPTCALIPAMISVTRTTGGVIGSVDVGTYSMAAGNGSNFRIDPTACQYIYSLAAL